MNDIDNKIKQLQKRLRSSVMTKEWLERTIISLGLYGKISGVIGPYIIANVNGKMIIRLRPRNFRMSQSKASAANRKNMAAANKFAMFLKCIEPVYNLWRIAEIPGNNAFTRIIRHNKKYLLNDSPSEGSSITPPGYETGLANIISTDKKGKIRISNEYHPAENERMVIVITALEPVSKGSDDFECFTLYCGKAEPGQLIRLSRSQMRLCSKYSRFLIYSAVIREEERSIKWSNTVVQKAEFRTDPYEDAERCGYGSVDYQSTFLSRQSGERGGFRSRMEFQYTAQPLRL